MRRIHAGDGKRALNARSDAVPRFQGDLVLFPSSDPLRNCLIVLMAGYVGFGYRAAKPAGSKSSRLAVLSFK